MFVNSVSSIGKIGFKGYEYIKNDVGETVMRFNYPYDYDNEACEIEIYKLTPTKNYNYKLEPNYIHHFYLDKGGVDINLETSTTLDKDEPFAYRYIRRDKKTNEIINDGADTGAKIKVKDGNCLFRIDGNKKRLPSDTEGRNYNMELNEFGDNTDDYKYTFVSRKGTTPITLGAGYLAVPDALMPGAKYRGFDEKNTGEVYFDEELQKKTENIVRTFSNQYGGSIAGLEYMIPQWKKDGYKIIFTTPIANGDDVSSHSYWNKNNMQIAPKMGNTENMASFLRKLYQNGMSYVYDGTFTSEGIEGIHFSYALRWANRDNPYAYWFRFDDIKNSSIGLGLLPENKENISHRVINPRFKYIRQGDGTYKPLRNPNYDEKKPTIYQVYDTSQVSKKQLEESEQKIRHYENINSDGKELNINTHDDTIMPYAFQINPEEYEKRVNVINDLIKNGRKISLYSPDGTILTSNFTNFFLTEKPGKGFQAWDANSDMVKLRYNISGYDEKKLLAIPDSAQRNFIRGKMLQATKEIQDITIQAAKYWTQKQKNIVTLYNAQTIGKDISVDNINKLIKEGKLPAETAVNEKIINNIKNGYYLLEPKGVLDKDSVTVKSLMTLPLDTLEFGEDIQGVLSTPWFSNRASSDETIGISRYDLMKENNPHLTEPYKNVYNKVNDLFNNELKKFADDVISEVNKNSDEPLTKKDSYTEYGEYVIELVGQDIAKYALLKSLSGSNFRVKILSNGDLTYDYDKIRETSLKSLDINASNPKEEAEILEKKIEKGLKNLSQNDIKTVAASISQRIKGTNALSFRLGEALFDRTGLGLNWRLDALKDIADMDAVRNRENSFDDNLLVNIKFWSKFVKEVKNINKNSILEAEITDIPDLMKDTYGLNSIPYEGKTNTPNAVFNGEPDALIKFFNETGITSEAAYSYMFTSVLKMLAPNFENGTDASEFHDDVKHRIDLLIQTRGIDYLKTLYTFLGNHDKPRVIHALALDLKLFHSPVYHHETGGAIDFERDHEQRKDIMKVLSGVSNFKDLPIELKLNVDNIDYFKTVSPRAAAQSKLLINAIDDGLTGKFSDDKIKLLKLAAADITDGNYLQKRESAVQTRINIPELSSLENAFSEVLSLASNHGLVLSENEKQNLIKNVVKQANSLNLDNYLVRGDFDWAEPNENIGNTNRNALYDIVESTENQENYSLYTIQLARLLKDSYEKTNKNLEAKNAIKEGLKDFANKFNRTVVNANSTPPKEFEYSKEAQKKNGYAARSIRKAAEMIVRQAEFKQNQKFSNKEELVEEIFKAATEPAITKAAVGTELLKSLIGINTTFYGDENGQTGMEDKAKNISQGNRLVMPDYTKTEYGKKIHEIMTNPIKDRNNPNLTPLNDGTPYMLDVVVNDKTRDKICERIVEINKTIRENNPTEYEKINLLTERHKLTRELAKFAYLRQSANGDMVVTLCDTGWINNDSRHDYFKENGITDENTRKEFFEKNSVESINPNNKRVPIMPETELDYILLGSGIALPLGTIFLNSNENDKARYVVKKFAKGIGIAKEDGGKIILNSKTIRNGVMNLFHKIGFKGHQNKPFYNVQFNIPSAKAYEADIHKEGSKLSIISKG